MKEVEIKIIGPAGTGKSVIASIIEKVLIENGLHVKSNINHDGTPINSIIKETSLDDLNEGLSILKEYIECNISQVQTPKN